MTHTPSKKEVICLSLYLVSPWGGGEGDDNTEVHPLQMKQEAGEPPHPNASCVSLLTQCALTRGRAHLCSLSCRFSPKAEAGA